MSARKKLKVAFLMQETRMGGIEYNSLHLAEMIDRETFEVVFLVPREGKLTGVLKDKNLPYLLYRCPFFYSTSFYFFGTSIFNPFASALDLIFIFFAAFSAARKLKKGNFDVVMTKGLLANFYGSLGARLCGIPSVWDSQEVVSGTKLFGILRSLLNIWAHCFVALIALPSEAIRQQYWDSLRFKIRLLPNGIDTRRFSDQVDGRSVRGEWGIAPDEILVGHIARFTYWKGQSDFIRAAAEISKTQQKIKFAVVGAPVFENERYETEIKTLARAAGLNGRMIFPGFRDDLDKVLAAIDIFVHSSIEPEGCPITLITAMSMKKPVIATRVLGNEEIVGENEGILIPPGSPRDIAHSVLKIAGDPELGVSLGSNARKRILEKYSIESYARNCERIFNESVK